VLIRALWEVGRQSGQQVAGAVAVLVSRVSAAPNAPDRMPRIMLGSPTAIHGHSRGNRQRA